MDWNQVSNPRLLELIGASVKARRVRQNLLQEELAQLSGVSHASIARFETGKGNISLKNLLLIMKALGMVEELKAIFQAPEASPALLAKAKTKKTRMRVRKAKKIKEDPKIWEWGEEND